MDTYFSGKEPSFTPPILMRTTPFRKQVWEIMLQIPYGHTMTYGEISDKIAKDSIELNMPVKALGETEVGIYLKPTVTAKIKVKIEALTEVEPKIADAKAETK